MAIAVGCQKKQTVPNERIIPNNAQAPVVRKLSPSEVLTEVSAALSVPGIPPPPLSKGTQKTARIQYLLTTEKALATLERLHETALGPRPAAANLLPPTRSEEIKRIGSALAVALAYAVESKDSKKALAIVRTTERYIQFVAEESINGYIESGAVYDLISQGLQSLGTGADPSIANALASVWTKSEGDGSLAASAIEAERVRIRSWSLLRQKNARDSTVAEVVNSLSENSGTRTAGNEALRKLITQFAKEKGNRPMISATVLAEEAKIAADSAIQILDPTAESSPTLDSKKHPIATVFLSRLRKCLIAASDLTTIRGESLRLVSLSAKLLIGPLPESLKPFGENAISPVTGTTFLYKRNGEQFDLLRPTKPVKGTTSPK